MVDEEACDIALGLGLGLSSNRRDQQHHQQQKAPVQLHILFPSHTKEEEVDDDDDEEEHKEHAREENGLRRLRLRSTADEEEDGDANNDGSNKRDGSRKKLRLSKEQSTLLEDSFRQHNTLNTTQKKELAERLSLKPRQVEVWFQNRRARTKLKQTEVDCEFLKKCCESLSDENRRLKKELQELRSIKPAARSPFYIQLAKAAKLTMCPSCERIVAAGGGGWKSGSGASSSTTTTTLEAMSMVAKPKFYNCTTAAKDSSSMACCK